MVATHSLMSHTEVAHRIVMIHLVAGCCFTMKIHTLVEDRIPIVNHTEVVGHKMMIHAVAALWVIFQRWNFDLISHLHKTHHSHSFVSA